jgi:hypothetical protein
LLHYQDNNKQNLLLIFCINSLEIKTRQDLSKRNKKINIFASGELINYKKNLLSKPI